MSSDKIINIMALREKQGLFINETDLEEMNQAELLEKLIKLDDYTSKLEKEHLNTIKAQEELEISRKKYFDSFESAPVGFLLIDAGGLVIDTNKRASDMLKTSREQIFNRNFVEYISPENKHIYLNSLQNINKLQQTSIETKLLVKDSNEELYCQLYLQLNQIGTRQFIRLTLNDISTQKKQEIELKQLKKSLSQKVFERTEELLKTNENLKSEVEKRRKAEDLVREREQRVNLIANNIPGGLYLAKYSSHVEFLYLNKEIEFLTGYLKEDFLTGEINYEDLFFRNERPKILKMIKDGLNNHGRFHIQYRIQMRNGQEKWLEEYGAEAYSAGKQQFIVGYIRDYSENHKIIEKLKESESRHRMLIENTLEGYWQVNNEIRTTHVNPALCNMLGYSKDELIGSDPRIYIHEEYIKQYQIQIDSLDNTEHRTYELVFIRKNGTKINTLINATTIKNNEGISVGSFALLTDITELKRTHEELNKSKKMLQLVIDNIPQFIFWKDKNSKYLGCNKNFARAAGVEKPEDIFGKFDDELPWDKAEARNYVTIDKRVMAMDKPEYHIIESQQQADGRKAWLDTNKIPLHDENGKVVGILGTFEDITKRIEDEKKIIKLVDDLRKSKNTIEKDAIKLRKLNKKLEESETQLKEINLNKDKFFSIVAHDLKSPLSSFLSLTRVFSEQYSSLSSEDLHDLAQNLYESANNVFKLMNNLLEWSRVQRGTISLNPHDILIKELTEATIEIVRMQAKQKNIDIELQCSDEFSALADHRMISTVIRNLLTNAIKFTPEKGKITVAINKRKNDIEISITDTGVGMNKDQLRKLFRIDVQNTTKGTSGELGTGLGLILCKEFVELNGGKISVTSQEGKGSSFKFTLPAENN